MHIPLINEKINEIRKLQQFIENKVSEETLGHFAVELKKMKNWDCLRINPLDFAEKNKMDADETVRLFIYGAKTGLFNFEWSLLCPLCGGREHSYLSLNQLEKEKYHCTLCDVDVEVEADSHLEVSFTLPKTISGFSLNPHSSLAAYWAFFFSSYIVWHPELKKAFDQQPPMRFFSIPAGKKASMKIGITPVKKYRVVSLDTHSIFKISMEGKAAASSQKIKISHGRNGFDKKEETIAGLKGELEIINSSPKTIGCLIASPDSNSIQEVVKKHPPYFKPFVTGKMMLNNQIFRDLFLVDNLPDDLSLKINDITLLFTDLKGSTELYDQTGDVNAYKLVQRHFKILQTIVNTYHGGIVKTMGDAIMASFNLPLDGLRAAYAMIKEIDAFNRTIEKNTIGLKIGLHRGSAIAVKANQTLDYFGQTVNIAARVQNLAHSGEIWVTDEIMDDAGIKQYIGSSGRTVTSKDVMLKGVGNFVKVHLC